MQGVLQDWLLIEGSPSSANLPTCGQWLNLEGYQNVTFWLEVRNVEGTTPILTLETAPAADPTFTTPMSSVAMDYSPALTVIKPFATAAPFAGLVRWRIDASVTATWRTMFRIHYSAKRRGLD